MASTALNTALKPLEWFTKEFGVLSVYNTGLDAWLVILSRSSRMFAYGATSLIIAVFFASLDFTDFQIGLFMTLTLGGDVLLSLFLTLIADRIGRRKILLAGAVLMIVSGTVFALFENFAILLLAAVVGVISATGGDFGPFRAIEESTLSHLTTSTTRSDVLSWYVTSSSLGSALGTEFAGRAVDFLSNGREWALREAYHAMFWLYVIMGVGLVGMNLGMSEKCEMTGESAEKPAEAVYERVGDEEQTETARKSDESDRDSLDDLDPAPQPQSQPPPQLQLQQKPDPPAKKSLVAQISPETRRTMYKLWFLLTVDSLADGMTSLALTYFYMDRKLSLSKSTLGDISSSSYFLAAASTVFASPLARRLGLVNTMVFTHVPSSMAVLFFPLPQGVFMTVALFYIRTGLNNMDQAPRTALIAAVVKPEERTAVMGITGMLRTLAGTIGPSITGWLAGTDQFWIAFVAAGILRLLYDFGLWALFIHIKVEGEQPRGSQRKDEVQGVDEHEAIELEDTESSVDGVK